MTLEGDYEPSPRDWVREQVEEYESSGGQRANTLRDTGLPIVIVTTRGNRTGKLRKTALMRVEHGGRYLVVASKGGHPQPPAWYWNVRNNPHVELQDGDVKRDYVARELEGDERAEWWERALEVWPDYASYQAKTERLIAVFLLEPIIK